MIALEKLSNVRSKEGKTIAACPACVADGHDSKQEHLVAYSNGAYTCVAHPGDREHSRRIYQLVGRKEASADRRLSVYPLQIPDSYVIMEIAKKPENVVVSV